MPTDKNKIQQRQGEIHELLRAFCSAKLNEECFELSQKLLEKMGRKRHVPFETGKIEIWAAAIIHALGLINFWFDKSQIPHTTLVEMNEFFGTKQSTVGSKSKIIRDIFKLEYWDEEFSTQKMQDDNPFRRMVVLSNGMIAFRTE